MDIFTSIRGLFSGGPIYIKIRKNLLSLRSAKDGKIIEDSPLIAIKKDKPYTILAIGKNAESDARKENVSFKLYEPFNHPRMIIGNFLMAEKVLMHLLLKLYASKSLRPAPVIVMHPLDNYEGGLTDIEVRVLRELGAGIGGREVYVWQGRGLTDSELLSGEFKKLSGINNEDINPK